MNKIIVKIYNLRELIKFKIYVKSFQITPFQIIVLFLGSKQLELESILQSRQQSPIRSIHGKSRLRIDESSRDLSVTVARDLTLTGKRQYVA